MRFSLLIPIILILISVFCSCCISSIDETNNVPITCTVEVHNEPIIPIDLFNYNHTVTVTAKNNKNVSIHNLNVEIECKSSAGWCENSEGSVFIGELSPNQSDSRSFFFSRDLECKYDCIPVRIVSY